MQSYKVPSSQVPGHSYVIRHPHFKDGSQGQKYKDVNTLWDIFQHEVTEFPKREFLGARSFDQATGKSGDYQWITTTDAGNIVDSFGSGLDHVYSKYAPEFPAATPDQQPLAIYSLNRPEWLLAEFAAFRSRRYTVGITDATGVESAETTFNNSESAVIVCSMDKIPRMLNRIKMAPTIKVIISMDSLDLSKPSISTQALSAETISELRKQAESAGVALLDMAEVIEMGRQTPTHANLPEPADICVVCYTSGTLAAQKGVVRTHAANVFASKCAYLSGSLSDSTYLSFIPITHCVDRNTIYALMYEHTRIGMSSGVPENLMDDFQTLRPTVFLAAPPILNKVYEKAAAATISAAGMVGMLSRYAYSSKLQQFKGGSGTKHAFWDMLLFGKVAQIFGGRVRTVYCGGSSLMPEVQDFFRIALSCDLIQGYGQTETFGCGTLQLTTDTTTGNIGVPMPGIDMRLRSVPDMDLSAESPVCPKGELMIRGKCLFSGYLKQPENSKDLVDDEGWMATDDIAQFNEDGTIKLIDRLKNCFKTARNCWVASESMEAIYATHPLVHNVFVHGTPEERDLVAVVSPEREQFIEWAQRYLSNTVGRRMSQQSPTSYEDICANKEVRKALVEELRHHALRNNLLPEEHIAAVHCEPTPFEHNSTGLFTSTRKLRRNVAADCYKREITELFAETNTQGKQPPNS